MKSYKIKIADCVIEIESDENFLSNPCCTFYTDEDADLHIRTIDTYYRKKDDAFFESDKEVIGWESNNSIIRFFEKLYEGLINYNIFVIHGAAIAVKQSGFVFTAPSGTGKTTHILKWLDNCSDVSIINGDKPFIKISKENSCPLVCGSPWAGKENLCSNLVVPLKSIILMERADYNYIEQISFAEAFPFLLQQIYRPNDEEKMRKTLRLVQKLSPIVSFWRFKCNNFKDDCFEVTYKALVGKSESK